MPGKAETPAKPAKPNSKAQPAAAGKAAGKATTQEKPNEMRPLPPAKMCQTKPNFKALAAGKASKARWQGLACCRRQSQQNQIARLNLLQPAKPTKSHSKHYCAAAGKVKQGPSSKANFAKLQTSCRRRGQQSQVARLGLLPLAKPAKPNSKAQPAAAGKASKTK